MSFQTCFISFPILETERLILRALSAKDAEAFHYLYSQPEVVRYLDWDGANSNEVATMIIDLFNQQYRKLENIRWAICTKADNSLIGSIVLGNIKRNAIADIGYDLSLDNWGKGIMSEALKAVIQYSFSDLSLKRIQAYVRPLNTPSAKLLIKLGFEKEGLLRHAGYHETRKEFYDIEIYSLLNPSILD